MQQHQPPQQSHHHLYWGSDQERNQQQQQQQQQQQYYNHHHTHNNNDPTHATVAAVPTTTMSTVVPSSVAPIDHHVNNTTKNSDNTPHHQQQQHPKLQQLDQRSVFPPPLRSSLGQFIERSTSAPPLQHDVDPAAAAVTMHHHHTPTTMRNHNNGVPSTITSLRNSDNTNNSSSSNTSDRDTTSMLSNKLFDNDLYEYVTKGYSTTGTSNIDIQRSSSVLLSAADLKSHSLSSNSAAFLSNHYGLTDDSGRATSQTTNTQGSSDNYLFGSGGGGSSSTTGGGGGSSSSSGPSTSSPIGTSRSIITVNGGNSNHYGSTIIRPQSASGNVPTTLNSRTIGGATNSSNNIDTSSLYHDFLFSDASEMMGLQRSQSAAPAIHHRGSSSLSSSLFLSSPPPGLSLQSSSSTPQQKQDYTSSSSLSDSLSPFASSAIKQIRRPQSAGVVSNTSIGAVRPAAKTLMELIQEDIPPPEYSIDAASNADGNYNDSNMNHQLLQQQQSRTPSSSKTPSPPSSSTYSIHDHNGNNIQSLTSTYTTPADGNNNDRSNTLVGSLSKPQQTGNDFVLQRTTTQLTSSSLQRQYSQDLSHPPQLQQQQQQQQQILQSVEYSNSNNLQTTSYMQQHPSDGPLHQYSIVNVTNNNNSPTLQQYQQPQQHNSSNSNNVTFHQQHHPKGFEDELVQQPPIYIPQQHQLVQNGQQQVFYNTGGQLQPQPQSDMLNNTNRVQINMPNTSQQLQPHQAVYINAAGQAHQQQSYGYTTTVQYQQPHHQQQQHQQLLHHHHHHPMSTNTGGQHDQQQYVSVVPIQRNAGAPVSYWQPNGIVQQHPHHQQVLFPASGLVTLGGQITNTMDGPTMYHVTTSGATGPAHGKGGQQQLRSGEKGSRGRRGGGNTNTGRGGHNRDGANMMLMKNSGMDVPTSSALLEEFRLAKSRDWTIRRIEGHVVEFCQDQSGSRFIQQRLEMGDHTEQQIVMKEVLRAIRRLRNDVFGNYVVQKLLDFGTAKMKSEIRDTLEGEMLSLSLQMYGCRVVQKAIETVSEEDLPRLLHEFHNDVLGLIHDQNGNHVIQKCIEVLNSRANKAEAVGDLHHATFLREQIDFILNDILSNATTLSCHPYGCRVLQRILEHCTEDMKVPILDEIKRCHKDLLDDQYGNYVIQHVLQFGRDVDRDSIVQIVVDCGLLGLARQKFASNVVEKLLKYGNSEQRRAVVREMLKKADDPTVPSEPGDGNTVVVLLMVRDAYANYVVQTTLDVVPESDEKRRLLQELNSHTDELKNYTFAKHIVAKLAILASSNQ